MLRVGLTQRVDTFPDRRERRDALDQAWTTLLEAQGFQPILISNVLGDPAAYASTLDIGALVLTGGNDIDPGSPQNAPERDRTEKDLLRWAVERKKPVLGVCRGFQIMNHVLGGSLTPMGGHVRTTHTLVPVTDRKVRILSVNSFHDWSIAPEGLAASLIPIYAAEDRTIEAAAHRDLPWSAVMWHPERTNPDHAFQSRLVRMLLTGKRFVEAVS